MGTNDTSPVYGYLKRPSLVDFPGRLAAVFFTSGCNFRCGFCHNYGELACRKPGMRWEQLGSACAAFREEWVEGAVITGGEPTLWQELPALITFLRQQGFAVKLDSNGSNPEMLQAVLPSLDYVAMDIKCSLATYPDMVACHHPAAIAASVNLLKQSSVPYEFRTTILESVHTAEEVAAMGELLKGARRYVIQPFLPRDDLPEAALRHQPRTPSGHLRRVAEWLHGSADEIVIRGD